MKKKILSSLLAMGILGGLVGCSNPIAVERVSLYNIDKDLQELNEKIDTLNYKGCKVWSCYCDFSRFQTSYDNFIAQHPNITIIDISIQYPVTIDYYVFYVIIYKENEDGN